MDSIHSSVWAALESNRGLAVEAEKLRREQPAALKGVVDNMMSHLVQSTDALALIDRFVEMLPVGEFSKEFVDEAYDRACKLAVGAEAFLVRTEGPISLSLQTQLRAWRDSLVILMENLLNLASVKDLVTPFTTKRESVVRGQRLKAFDKYYAFLAVLLGFLVCEGKSKKIAAVILVTMGCLSLIYPYIQPFPSALPYKGENLRKRFAEGDIKPALGDPALCQQVMDNLLISKIHECHTLILGGTGAGKSNLALAVAKQIFEGALS